MPLTQEIKINGNPYQLSFSVQGKNNLDAQQVETITKIFLSVLRHVEGNGSTQIDPNKAFTINLYEGTTTTTTQPPQKNYTVKIFQETAPNNSAAIFEKQGGSIAIIRTPTTPPATENIAIPGLPTVTAPSVNVESMANSLFAAPPAPSLGSPPTAPRFSLQNKNLTFTRLFQTTATPAPAAAAAPAPAAQTEEQSLITALVTFLGGYSQTITKENIKENLQALFNANNTKPVTQALNTVNHSPNVEYSNQTFADAIIAFLQTTTLITEKSNRELLAWQEAAKAWLTPSE